jgi:hypothetical protein
VIARIDQPLLQGIHRTQKYLIFTQTLKEKKYFFVERRKTSFMVKKIKIKCKANGLKSLLLGSKAKSLLLFRLQAPKQE